MPAAIVALVLVWVTFPAGGVYPWVWIPAAAIAAVLAVLVRPLRGSDAARLALDAALVAAAAAITIQLIPLPPALLASVSPHAIDVRTALWLPTSAAGGPTALPISIVPRDTAEALGIAGAAVLFFWVARRACDAGGAGRIVRAVAAIGLVASVAAIVQRWYSPELIYGVWRPVDAGARPFGPFVNRNHFATWIVMACPLVFGYVRSRRRQPSGRRPLGPRIAAALADFGSIRTWLMISLSVMTLALIVSASRSGVIGLATALLCAVLLGRKHSGGGRQGWALAQVALIVAVAAAFAGFDPLMDKFDQALRPGDAGRGRRAIWADAVRLAADFPAAGTGAGTFGTAVVVYQTAEPGYAIGQAHNHYLQIAAEGGMLIGVPVVLCFAAFARVCGRELRAEEAGTYALRCGALAGIAGVMVQSLWETGLRMPANAMLLAVLAAAATSRPPSRSDADESAE